MIHPASERGGTSGCIDNTEPKSAHSDAQIILESSYLDDVEKRYFGMILKYILKKWDCTEVSSFM